MEIQNFKQKIGDWLWKFSEEMEQKDRQFAILDCSNRLNKQESLLVVHEKVVPEVLSSTLELQYILESSPKEFRALLTLLVGISFTEMQE